MAQMTLDLKALQAELNNAIDTVMRTHASEAFLSRWMLTAETVDNDGERGLWLVCCDAMKPWEVLGMTAYAHEQAKYDAVYGTPDGDED
jgi:hypothetical protein